ncbi:MAG: hypothetical protein ABJA98_35225 [Acidobacteriota bacterium]
MEGAAIDWMTETVLAALEHGDSVDATALTFLLRRFRDTDRADLRDALEPALAGGLERQTLADSIGERAAWLTLFADALTLSADDRLLAATTTLLGSLQREWGRSKEVEDASVSVDASLRACSLLDLSSIAPHAVDELERIVAAAYRPGEGLAHDLHDRTAGSGQLADHIFLASALLTAYEISGRLPYSMLAEELVQVARHIHWSEVEGCFESTSSSRWDAFRLNCEAARVLCRLGALHNDRGYRAAAVIRSDAAYADAATSILRAQDSCCREFGVLGAVYGLALSERLALG